MEDKVLHINTYCTVTLRDCGPLSGIRLEEHHTDKQIILRIDETKQLLAWLFANQEDIDRIAQEQENHV